MAIVPGLLGCAGTEATYEIPPLLASSTETSIAPDEELFAQCQPLTGVMAGSELSIEQVQFTNSERWGNIMRSTAATPDGEYSYRLVCTGGAVGAGVSPRGRDENIPHHLRGSWAVEGNCAEQDRLLLLTDISVQLGTGEVYEIRYFPEASGTFWTIDGTSWAPQYDSESDRMIWTDSNGITYFERCESPEADRTQ